LVWFDFENFPFFPNIRFKKKKKKNLTFKFGLFFFVAPSNAKADREADWLAPISTKYDSVCFSSTTPTTDSPWTGTY